LREFRNFAELELHFPVAGVAIIGDNGSGKTNLLESIYYLEIFRSFRGAPDEQLVRFGEPAFHIRGTFEEVESGATLEITAAYEPRTRTKRVTVDGAEPERLADAVGRVRVVAFSPSDMSLVAGSPAERRRFLDIVLSVNVPGYLDTLQRYRQVLRQRNALLRTQAEPALIEAWAPHFLAAGARLMQERAQWITQYAQAFARRYERVGDGAKASIEYRPGLRADPAVFARLEQVEQAFCAETERAAARERERGVTLVGPHRDDIAILADTTDGRVDLREFGSGGQVRTAAIALRMIEAESARGTRGAAPMILLDDVFAELDPGRSRRVLEMLEAEGHGQVILTAPKATDVDRQGAGRSFAALPRWSIRQGVVQAGP
jgi:DNA replication and repair protein RecF